MTINWGAAVNALFQSGVTAVQIADATHSSRQAVYLWAAGSREPQGSNITLLTALCNKRNIKLQAKKIPLFRRDNSNQTSILAQDKRSIAT